MQRLPPRPVVGHAAVAFGELESLSLAFGSPVEGVPEVGRISLEDVFFRASHIDIAIIVQNVVAAVKIVVLDHTSVFFRATLPQRSDFLSHGKGFGSAFTFGVSKLLHLLFLEIGFLCRSLDKLQGRNPIDVAVHDLLLQIYADNKPLPLKGNQSSIFLATESSQRSNFPVGTDVNLRAHNRLLNVLGRVCVRLIVSLSTFSLSPFGSLSPFSTLAILTLTGLPSLASLALAGLPTLALLARAYTRACACTCTRCACLTGHSTHHSSTVDGLKNLLLEANALAAALASLGHSRASGSASATHKNHLPTEHVTHAALSLWTTFSLALLHPTTVFPYPYTRTSRSLAFFLLLALPLLLAEGIARCQLGQRISILVLSPFLALLLLLFLGLFPVKARGKQCLPCFRKLRKPDVHQYGVPIQLLYATLRDVLVDAQTPIDFDVGLFLDAVGADACE
mmetsp:Transcript_25612/g.40497  ORF Transcript_25612/g.40497 Transcript_25612/m.40497 type:complete len:452 (-) Transcript_25612:2002-3357(-)